MPLTTGARALLRDAFALMLGLSPWCIAYAAGGSSDGPLMHVRPSTTLGVPKAGTPDAAQPRGTPPGITVVESGGTTGVTEGGAGDSHTIVLDSQPTSTVTVSLAFDPAQLVVDGDTDGSVDLVFTPVNWSVAQTVTVAAVDDTVVESAHTATIVQSASSADPSYAAIDPADVIVALTDNDTAEIIFSSAGFVAIEGAVFSPGATLKVSANGAPGGSIGVPITASMSLALGNASTDDVTVSGSSTFPAGSAHDTVVTTSSVAVVDDRLVEATETFTLALVVDSGPASSTASNTYQIDSDDFAAITFASTSSTPGEAAGAAQIPAVVTVSGSGSGAAGLGTGVTVAVNATPGSASSPADYQLVTSSLTFPAGTASGDTRDIEVAIVDDALIEGGHDFTLGFGTVTSDASGVFASGTHSVTVLDDDAAGVTVVTTGGDTTVSEGGADDSVTLQLTAQPQNVVTITFDTGTQVGFAPNPLVFTPGLWNVPQTVTVSAIDDVLIEGSHAATVGLIFTGDSDFAAITPNSITVPVSINDNDVPGVRVTESGGGSTAAEGGAGDSYTVQLESAPTGDVSIAIDAGSQLQVTPAMLTFTPANWGIAQTVDLVAIDDDAIEGPHSGMIVHGATSADPNYDGIAVAAVTVAVVDNDAAGVSLVASDGSTTVNESGGADSLTVQLTAQPASDVTISFDVGTQVSFAPNPLLITPAQWNLPQTVTVTAVDDALAQGTRTLSVGLGFSGDAAFAAIPAGSVAVALTVIDDDSAGVVLSASGGGSQVAEGGASDDYTLLLQSQPTADVQIAIDGGSQLLASPALLTFTTGNWNLPQTVTLSAVDDALAEGPHSGNVSHTVTSADPDYSGFAIPVLPVGIIDNDLLASPHQIPASREAVLAVLAMLLGLFAALALRRRPG